MEEVDMSPEKVELQKYRDIAKIYTDNIEYKKNFIKKLTKEIEKFEEVFTKTVGRRYDILREIDYNLDAYMKKDEKIRKKIETEYTKFREYAIPARNIQILENKNNGIKGLYKEIVKEIHPDRSSSEEDRTIKTNILKEINIAYGEGNKEKMLVVYNKWKYDPESLNTNTVGEELIFAIRHVYKLKKDVSCMDKDIEDLKNSEIYLLKKEVDRYKGTNRNPIKDLCISLNKEIQNKRQLLRVLQLLEEKSCRSNKVRSKSR